MNDRLRLLIFPLLAAGIGLVAGEAKGHGVANLTNVAATAAVLQDSGQRIGVVDAERLSEESDLGKRLSERLRAFQSATEERVNALRSEIEQLENALNTVAPTSDQARELRRRRQVKIAEFQTEQQVFSAELQVILRQSNVQLLRATNAAARKVAADKGFSLVLRKSPGVPANFDPTAQNAGEQLERIITRNVTLYVDPSIDITSLVLTQMNADFEAGGGEIPAPPAPPAEPTTTPGILDTPAQPTGQ